MNEYVNGTGYFENRDCKYYPCHLAEHINCMFCYCPLYPYADCPGDHTWIKKGNVSIKNCTDCLFPHRSENYEKVIRFLSDHMHAECDGNKETFRGFYASKTEKVRPVDETFADIRSPEALYDLLRNCWCKETCAPRMRDGWSDKNPTLGQCSVTAFLAQDIFGGKVFGIPRKDGSFHCYNVVGDSAFDLTSEQFGDEELDYSDNPEQFREIHFEKAEKKARYELLKKRLSEQREAKTD